MTLKQIEILEATRRMYHDFRGFAQIHQQRLCDALMERIEQCDHEHPDGSSAIKRQTFWNVCQICGRSDT